MRAIHARGGSRGLHRPAAAQPDQGPPVLAGRASPHWACPLITHPPSFAAAVDTHAHTMTHTHAAHPRLAVDGRVLPPRRRRARRGAVAGRRALLLPVYGRARARRREGALRALGWVWVWVCGWVWACAVQLCLTASSRAPGSRGAQRRCVSLPDICLLPPLARARACTHTHLHTKREITVK